jgi:hypothetical protein
MSNEQEDESLCRRVAAIMGEGSSAAKIVSLCGLWAVVWTGKVEAGPITLT